MLAILELDGRFLHTWLADSRSKGTASLGSAPAIRRYKVRLYRINTHEVTIYSAGGLEKAEGVVLAIPELDVRFLHNRSTDFESVTWASLGSTPATRRYKVRLLRISIHGVRHPSESGLLSLIILNPMADSSTTTLPILNQSLGRHWALRQLHAGMRYVSCALVFMKFATLLRVVFCL